MRWRSSWALPGADGKEAFTYSPLNPKWLDWTIVRVERSGTGFDFEPRFRGVPQGSPCTTLHGARRFVEEHESMRKAGSWQVSA